MKILVKNRSGHDMSHMGPYLKSFLPYAQKRMGFNRPPTIFFDSDPQNAENVLGKTAYYNPETEEIVVFVDKRHPKDILRSLSHELVHHSQNCRGELNPEIAGETTPGYAQTNTHMRDMESEAYKYGNGLYFRDWEDSLKNGLEETNYKHITGDTHKMATYDQLKEEITAKVVAAITEKLTNKVEEEAKPDFLDLDGDGDKKEPMKKAAKEKELKEEEEEELEERKKRDTPRDSDRREAEKLKINEEEEEEDMTNEIFGLGNKKKRRGNTDAQTYLGHYARLYMKDWPNPQETTMKSIRQGWQQMVNDPDMSAIANEAADRFYDAVDAAQQKGDISKMEQLAKIPKGAVDEKVVEEAVSNDEWYQNELFESLKKRWTK